MQYEIKKYKDGQLSAEVFTVDNLKVKLKGSSYEDLFAAASIKEAWDSYKLFGSQATLEISCLIGQRSDRRFESGTSFDLKVICNFINSMKYDKVRVLHPHSSVTAALIDRYEEISPFIYIEKAFEKSNSKCIVSPDAGAYKDSYKYSEMLHCPLIASNKVRDENGEPLINVSGDVSGKKCLIVDDLADGGRTFVKLSQELKNQGAKLVSLYVTHGQFNYGFDEIFPIIDHVYTTDSFREINHPRVTQFKIK